MRQPSPNQCIFSVFIAGIESLRPLSYLLDAVRPPTQRGSILEVFLNAVTRGSICGVVGKRPSLLMTDAATALGSEGGPVFTEGPTKELVGMVVCSVSWCRGEWVGLSLVAPLTSVLSAKLRVAVPQPAKPLAPHPLQDVLIPKSQAFRVLSGCERDSDSALSIKTIYFTDESNLAGIENNKEMIQAQWRLMPYRSKI
ncbi:hypothetical protein HF086_017844 [Spodoptera exigua]|uniref:Peroxisomal leader peptide-processing protease n=1 Tax=Spodoptera exigua TaxID=7107 RepID=A0A922SLL2_SPOEX|nr:hypothetical protein HF086_017844 [Spodoptera exigua]